MSTSSEESAYGGNAEITTTAASQAKYKGIRRRKWGKWVSEIRVPGTPDRLWLGSYASPEAAAVAHDVAYYCLRGNSSPENLNFPLILPSGVHAGMSPRSVQRAASDAGLAVDARLLDSKNCCHGTEVYSPDGVVWKQSGGGWDSASSDPWSYKSVGDRLDISVEDYF